MSGLRTPRTRLRPPVGAQGLRPRRPAERGPPPPRRHRRRRTTPPPPPPPRRLQRQPRTEPHHLRLCHLHRRRPDHARRSDRRHLHLQAQHPAHNRRRRHRPPGPHHLRPSHL